MRNLIILPIFISLLIAFFFYSTAFSQNIQELGIVTAVKGTVNVSNNSGFQEVKEGSVVLLGDIFETSGESGVKIFLDDDTLISLGENTKYEFNEFIFTPNIRESISNITKGKMRAIIRKIKGDDANIKFISPNAVAGIKGTTLYIHVEDNLFAVKEGIVSVKGLRRN